MFNILLFIMPWCVVIGCKNNLKATKRAGKDISYHIFPKNPQRRNAWISSLNRPRRFNADSSYVCSEHFIPDDFECYSLKEELLNIKVKRQLKKTAIPSINIPKLMNDEQLDVTVNLSINQNPNDTYSTCNKNISTNQLEKEQHCAVPMCHNFYHKTDLSKNSSNIIFHEFPSDNKIFDQWLEFCNQSKDLSPKYKNAVICSDHFNKDNYEMKLTTGSLLPVKQLKENSIPTLNREIIKDIKRIERKQLVDKLIANYEEQLKNERDLKGVSKYPFFFSPKINPNAKLGDKLKLLKSIDNPDIYSPPKKRKISESSKCSSESIKLPIFNNSQNKDQVIQVSAVKGGLMLHALPHIPKNISRSSYTEKNYTEEDEEVIIVTEDEASFIDLTLCEEQHKENNTEIIIVTNLKETEDSLKHVENVPQKCPTKIHDSNIKYCVHNRLENNDSRSSLYSAKVSLSEEKACQVLIPCKGCEQRSLKINKLLRERTRLLRDLNQNGAWKDPDEISTLRKMNGVLSMLLMQYVSEKNGKKSSSIRIDLVKDSIDRVNRGWSMQDTSETLCQVLSINAYDEFARTFEIVNEI